MSGRGRDSAPPVIEANNGAHGQTGAVLVFVLTPFDAERFLFVNGISIPAIAEPIFFSLSFGLWSQSGSGLLPATRRPAAARGKPDALLAPPKGG